MLKVQHNWRAKHAPSIRLTVAVPGYRRYLGQGTVPSYPSPRPGGSPVFGESSLGGFWVPVVKTHPGPRYDFFACQGPRKNSNGFFDDRTLPIGLSANRMFDYFRGHYFPLN